MSVLSQHVPLLWPRRSQQELLLGLGERKSWTDQDREESCARLTLWLHEELGLPADLEGVPAKKSTKEEILVGLTGLGLRVDRQVPGVGGIYAALAELTGASSAKTLANSLIPGLQPKRPDHRWILLLSRLGSGRLPLDALLYHRRSVAAVTTALRAGSLDTSTALLLYSLVALQQRRRTIEGKPLPRRFLSKPVSALSGTLLVHSQLRPLLTLAREVDRGDLAAFVLECALTEAHLLPHLPRQPRNATSVELSAFAERHTGERWLQAVEQELSSLGTLLGEDAAFFSFRVAWMRSWRKQHPLPTVPPEISEQPYIFALQQLQRQKNGETADQVSADSPGLFMLLPLLRKRGLLR